MNGMPFSLGRCLASGLFVLTLTTISAADWQPGDGHKMHFPQLPDPQGWDVDITRRWIADDWRCSATGPVTDLHFWISYQDDFYAQDPFQAISEVWVRFYGDVPAGQDPRVPYSYPSQELIREYKLPAGAFQIGNPQTGPQGWYTPDLDQPIVDPATPTGEPNHFEFYQVNIDRFDDPFIQERGNIYWVALHVIPVNPPAGGPVPLVGWKTADGERYPDPFTGKHFNDDAVYDIAEQDLPPWMELFDPLSTGEVESLDMAFVITPEPATLGLLAVGGLLMLRRR